MLNKFSKILRIFLIVTVIFVIGGLGGVFFERSILPKLATDGFFSKFGIVKRASENVTVINKTERVVVREDLPIGETISKASASVVKVVSTSKEGVAGEIGESIVSTGLVISSDGVIMANKSAVLEEGASYDVFVSNSKYEAKVIGVDEYMDLAFFRVEASNLSVIPFADSENLKSGQRLIAIGSFSNTDDKVSAVGFMEGFDRAFNLAGKSVSYSDKLEGVLAMSFDCSDGYVGGPVINYDGELVGVTGKVVIDNKVRYFQIPSNSIREGVEKMFKESLENRAKLGVYYIPVTKVNAKALGVNREAGALVYSSSNRQGLAVVSGLAGDKSGVKVGDVIISVNGEVVTLERPLSALVGKYSKGEVVSMVVIRNGKEVELKIEF